MSADVKVLYQVLEYRIYVQSVAVLTYLDLCVFYTVLLAVDIKLEVVPPPAGVCAATELTKTFSASLIAVKSVAAVHVIVLQDSMTAQEESVDQRVAEQFILFAVCTQLIGLIQTFTDVCAINQQCCQDPTDQTLSLHCAVLLIHREPAVEQLSAVHVQAIDANQEKVDIIIMLWAVQQDYTATGVAQEWSELLGAN